MMRDAFNDVRAVFPNAVRRGGSDRETLVNFARINGNNFAVDELRKFDADRGLAGSGGAEDDGNDLLIHPPNLQNPSSMPSPSPHPTLPHRGRDEVRDLSMVGLF